MSNHIHTEGLPGESGRREIEWAPAGEAVTMTALRRLPAERAAQLRESVPAAIGRLLREVPGAQISLEMGADDAGIVEARLVVTEVDDAARDEGTGDEGTWDEGAELADAIETIVAPFAETAQSRWSGMPAGRYFPLVLADGDSALGFAVGPARSARRAGMWKPERANDIKALLAGLAALPGIGLSARVRLVDDAYRVALGVCSPGRPGIGVRALVRGAFPGLVVGDATGDDAVWLGVEEGDLSSALPIPVGGPAPMPGCYTAPAAPIPVAPMRDADPDDGVRLGVAMTAAGGTVPVRMSAHERVRHLHLLGRTGTGKSSTIAGIAREVVTSGEGLIMLDPHGTLVDRMIAEFPAEHADHLWVIRCGDVDNAVPMSTLAETDPVQRDIAIDATCAIFQEVFDKKEAGIVGPRFRERVAMGMRALITMCGERASILDVPTILGDDDVMAEVMRKTADRRLVMFWKNDKRARQSSDHGELVSWVNSKFEAFSSTAAIRAVLGSGHDAIDFADAMDAGRIILVDLSKAEIGESAARMLGYLYLNRVWAGALARTDRARPFTVIVDEAQALLSGSLSTMLAEGRKFGLSVVIGHQYIDQLDEHLRPAVDGNVGTTIAFRSAVSDIASLGMRFGGLVEPSTLTTLPDLSAVVMRSAVAAAVPYTVVVDHNSRVTARTGRELVEFEALVREQSHRDLVDPYRVETADAARGVSRIAAVEAKEAREDSGRHSSFLDEWLARRRETLERDDDESAEADSDTDPDTDAETGVEPEGEAV